MVSGFRNKINCPVAFLIAKLLAFEKPRLDSFQIKSTFGKSVGSTEALSSLDALSTTIISASIFLDAFSTECKQASMKYLTL
jgi:hypothetical protein